MEQAEDTVVAVSYTVLAAGTTPIMVLNQNQRRRALILIQEQGSSFIIPNGPNVQGLGANSNTIGINGASNLPLVLSRELHHALVTCAWFGVAQTTADVVCAIEVLEK